jgi:hypothetical protein
MIEERLPYTSNTGVPSLLVTVVLHPLDLPPASWFNYLLPFYFFSLPNLELIVALMIYVQTIKKNELRCLQIFLYIQT